MMTLGLYWLWQERAMLSIIPMLQFAEVPAEEKYDVVALFIQAARTIVVITAMRYVFCYTIVLPSFFSCLWCPRLSLISLLLSA
jgi:hypothetical protein